MLQPPGRGGDDAGIEKGGVGLSGGDGEVLAAAAEAEASLLDI